MQFPSNARLSGASVYDMFEHAIMVVLTLVIVLLVGFATWHLVVDVVGLLLSDQLNPANPAVFQSVFGMFFTVVIGLEFKRSLLVVSGRQESVVRVRSIILIGMLATVRKFIVLDLSSVDAPELFAVAAAMLALGIVYWLVRDQDRRVILSKPTAGPHEPKPGLPHPGLPGTGLTEATPSISGGHV